SSEKGIVNLIEAARRMPEVRFAIAGHGPEEKSVVRAVAELSNWKFLGTLSQEGVKNTISKSRTTILPSICNESLGLFALESFVQGRRCVVPDLDSTRWLAQGDFPGVLTNTSDIDSLRQAIGEAAAAPEVP